MSYAIIETGGKQLRVEPGRFYDVERLPVAANGTLAIDKVLLIAHEDEITVGQPFVDGAVVEGTILDHRRGKKILVYKMKPKKKTRKKRGHRQELTRLMIDSISMNGQILDERATETRQPAATTSSEEEE
jgi:large subunit ribosomal protein L21